MEQRWLLNITLVLVIGVLVLFAAFGPRTGSESAAVPLTARSTDSISRLRLIHPGRPEVSLERRGNEWFMTQPRQARANAIRVSQLLRIASAPVSAQFEAKSDALAQYGLDKPIATVMLDDDDIRFGTMHPIQRDIYVWHAGSVKLVPAASLQAATARLDDLFSPHLLDESLKVTEIVLPGFRLKQNAQGGWTTVPPRDDLTSDRINRFVNEWRHASALSVVESPSIPARTAIAVHGTIDGKPRTLMFAIAARRPELVLVRRDEKLAYHFPDGAVSQLLELHPEPDAPVPAASGRPN